MTILYLLCTGFSLLFSLTCFSFDGGSALAAFLLSCIFTLAFIASLVRFRRTSEHRTLSVFRKLLEYLPFVLFAAFIIRRAGGTEPGFFLDLASALVWTALTITGLILQYRLSDKRVARYYPEIENTAPVKKNLVVHTLEWVDALVQAACLVLLINLFFFQLYAIPSESMVPEFMIKDRVLVVKTPSGPKFPLTRVGIPRMRDYDRGDIVVFNNPHYNDTREGRIRSFASQLVYMLTFTAVNINRDESGALKADPLVKRVVGVPGEKLMMVDGVLYADRQDGTGFVPVPEEAGWAAWDIASLPRSELSLVQNVPLSRKAYDLLLSVESIRAALDVAKTREELAALADRFESLKPSRDTVGYDASLVTEEKREIVALFQANDQIARILLTTNGGAAWLRAFLTGWEESGTPDTLYGTRSRNCNLLLKRAFGKLVVRNAELMIANATAASFANDPVRMALLSEAENYRFFMAVHDQRNMPVFPEIGVIPADSYMLMGDNRFNSLDMRHSYSVRLAPVDPADSLSFMYYSNLEPQYVPVERILGTASFRFWPVTRIGVPR